MLNISTKKVFIPTYEVGEPDKNPMFFDKRVYQASSGKIYPYPIIDKVYDDKINKEYEVVILKNDYIEIMVMPSLGGRIQYGYDRINDYYFFYNNEVIKPALVGLCGPWISGGVEFNWPQHHRPSTFSKVEFDIEYGEGYGIVWLNELEKMSQLVGVAGIKIYEESNRIEVLGRTINNTNIPKTFLWWANAAVHCHENYESFFPKDVFSVADHGKREITSYPYANNQYYNIDYLARDLEKRNITNYKNINVPMSYMAVGSKYNFFGGYDFSERIGTMHVSNVHTAPGKKQWTWGSGKFGEAWDRNLTDSNGPYIELMAGIFTDNQPDFTWINPGETKEFSQTWYPFKDIGKALNADEKVAYSINSAELRIFSTINQHLKISICYENQTYQRCNIKISVGETVNVDISSELKVKSIDVNGLIYKYEKKSELTFEPAIEAKLPDEIDSIDELYNIGLHLEQYRHATRDSRDYYHKILEIDKFDSRANTRMGYISLEAGRIVEAISYFKVAVEAVTKYNPNPSDCTAIFGLASAYKYYGENELAYSYFFKSIWDAKFKAKGYLELAKLDFSANRIVKALENIGESLKYDTRSIQAITIQYRLLELIGEKINYKVLIKEASYNYYARYYHSITEFLEYVERDDKILLEIIEFLSDLGCIDEAKELIVSSGTQHPILLAYYINNGGIYGYKLKIENIFPHTVFERLTLEKYLENNESNEMEFLLSLLLIDKNERELAYSKLNKIKTRGYRNSIFLRILAICEFNLQKNAQLSLSYYLNAIELNPEDARLVYEYDQLNKILNIDPNIRFEFLNVHMDKVQYRDDLKIEYSWLLCQLSKFDECINFMENSRFHPFEGSEGKVIEIYKTAKLAKVKLLIKEKMWEQGLNILRNINDIPECLGEAVIDGSPNADTLYFLGICHEGLKNMNEAHKFYHLCVNEQVISTSKLSYKPERQQMACYQALAYKKLCNPDEQERIITELVETINEKLNSPTHIDYFAISVPEFSVFDVKIDNINKAHCYYLLAFCMAVRGEETLKEHYIEKCKDININKLELVLM